jgi:hypothetical protein
MGSKSANALTSSSSSLSLLSDLDYSSLFVTFGTQASIFCFNLRAILAQWISICFRISLAKAVILSADSKLNS